MAGYGFVPAYHLTGGVIRPQEFAIASEYAANIFTGDVVIVEDAGVIEVGAATDNAVLLGVFGGCQYVAANGEQVFSRYWPTGTVATNIKALVYADPWIVYKAQSDQDTNALVATNVWSNGDFLNTAGSTLTGTSGFVLNSDTFVTKDATPAVGNFQLLGSAQLDGGYTAAGTTMDAYVRFAEHIYLGGSVALGVGL